MAHRRGLRWAAQVLHEALIALRGALAVAIHDAEVSLRFNSAGKCSSNAISASLYKKLSFDFIHDTVPVAGVMLGGQVQILSRAHPRGCHGPLRLADVPRLLQAQGVSRGVSVRRTPRMAGLSVS
jgi:hypothetical protein